MGSALEENRREGEDGGGGVSVGTNVNGVVREHLSQRETF